MVRATIIQPNKLADFISRYGLRPGDAIPQKGVLAYTAGNGMEYRDMIEILEAGVTSGVLRKQGADKYFVV